MWHKLFCIESVYVMYRCNTRKRKRYILVNCRIVFSKVCGNESIKEKEILVKKNN